MNKNDVLAVGAASAVILVCSAWLTGYMDNRLFGWLGVLAVIGTASGAAWYTRKKSDRYQEIAKQSAVIGATVYVIASILGLVMTRWAHGTWSPELVNMSEGVMTKLFSSFPGSLMKTILHPTFSSIIFGSLLMAVWCALGSSFLPFPDSSNSKVKKGRK